MQDRIVLLSKDALLDLWPLVQYGRAEMSRLGHPPTVEEKSSPQIYYRADKQEPMLFAALGVDILRSERRDSLADFRQLFFSRKTSEKETVRDYEAEIRYDAERFVGRLRHLRYALKVIKEQQSGICWLSGPAGIGKTYLMAKSPPLPTNPAKNRDYPPSLPIPRNALVFPGAFGLRMPHAVTVLRSSAMHLLK